MLLLLCTLARIFPFTIFVHFHSQTKRSYDIEQNDLKATYKKLMNEFHPDRHTLKSQAEQEEAAQQASKISRSYEVLSDNHERALHLLDLGGMPMEDDISGDILGHAFLMEVMELREEIDDAVDEKQLQMLQKNNRERIDDTCQKLSLAFQQNDLGEAKRLTAMLQYWKRIDELINEKS